MIDMVQVSSCSSSPAESEGGGDISDDLIDCMDLTTSPIVIDESDAEAEPDKGDHVLYKQLAWQCVLPALVQALSMTDMYDLWILGVPLAALSMICEVSKSVEALRCCPRALLFVLCSCL